MIHRALGHLLSCKDVSRLVSQAEDRPLTRWQRWRMRLHLAACDGCSRFEAQMRFLRRAMRRLREGD
jgi:putative zinc finger protein